MRKDIALMDVKHGSDTPEFGLDDASLEFAFLILQERPLLPLDSSLQ